MVSTPPVTITNQAEAAAVIQQGLLQHVAIIMDGNRRWAKRNILEATQGHYHGYKALKAIVRYASDILALPALTVYAFSTENWRRSEHEVAVLLKLFQESLDAELGEMVQKNLRLKFIGDISPFPQRFQNACQHAEALTASNTGMIYQVALNYGGRAELVNAVKGLANQVQQGKIAPDAITEDSIQTALYTANAPDPDLVIRTGGEYRLSNFLLWQAAYAELYVTETPWPEFTPEALNQAILEFERRHRRFGQ